jgi:hypothetical protein
MVVYTNYMRDGCLCWTLTSNGYKYLTWNFYKTWVRVHPGQPLLILCADAAAHMFFRREGVPAEMVKRRLPDYGPNIVQFGSENFKTLNALKLELLAEMASTPQIESCIYFDGDIVLYKPCLADLKGRLQEHPLWFQCDEQTHICTNANGCPNACTGLIVFRHGIDARIFQLTDQPLWARWAEQDQPYVNARILEFSVAIRSLPVDVYPNGFRMTQRAGAVLLHYNYLIGNQKVGMMKRNGDWFVQQL